MSYNKYLYVYANPIRYIDPTGLCGAESNYGDSHEFYTEYIVCVQLRSQLNAEYGVAINGDWQLHEMQALNAGLSDMRTGLGGIRYFQASPLSRVTVTRVSAPSSHTATHADPNRLENAVYWWAGHNKMVTKTKTLIFFGIMLLAPLMIIILPIVYGRLQPPEKGLQAIMNSGVNCSAPCWRDLTPGVSTTAEVEAFIIKLEESKNLLTFTRYIGLSQEPKRRGTDDWYGWEDLTNGGYSIQVSEDGVVESIRFSNEKITYKMIANYLQIPDAYIAAYTPHVHYPIVYYHIYLYYPQYGVKVTLSFPEDHPNYNNCRFVMDPDTHVWSIVFLEPASTGQEMRDKELRERWSVEPIKPWDSSGEIELSPCRPSGM